MQYCIEYIMQYQVGKLLNKYYNKNNINNNKRNAMIEMIEYVCLLMSISITQLNALSIKTNR
jgi:hypothetical protein